MSTQTPYAPRHDRGVPDKPGTHLRLDYGEDGVAIVRVDVKGTRQNILTEALAAEFDTLLATIERDTEITGVVVMSVKPGSFIAGADLALFDRLAEAADFERVSLAGQAILRRLARLHVPVVAAIEGACLGGGLELALACDIRVAADTPATVLGLPEVMLGLLPAAGGTQRLPRLIGIRPALEMMLTGRKLRPARALSCGLVDSVVAPEALEAEAIRWARRSGKRSPTRKPSLLSRATARWSQGGHGLANALLEDNPAGRRVLFDRARQGVRAKTHGHYPAPDHIIDTVALGYRRGVRAGYAAEARAFALLATSSASRALRHLHHASETLKTSRFVDARVDERPIERVGVLGAGLMGSGIALVSVARAGCTVRIKDVDTPGLARGLGQVRAALDDRVARGRLSRAEADRLAHSVTGTTDFEGIGAADLVVEAVFEDLALKRSMLAEFELAAEAANNPGAIFASNTSSLPIAEIAADARRPDKVIGLHYFSPVEKMPLLEIIAAERTAASTIARAVAFGRAQGKTVIVVRDGPGFYTTRVLSPYLNEAARLLTEGAGVRQIDAALRRHGFPVGPLALLDEVGVDVGAKVAPILQAAFGQRMAAPEATARMIEAGFLGRKTGRGFYEYERGVRRGRRPVNARLDPLLVDARSGGGVPDAAEIVERCTLALVNEAAHCLSDGVIEQPLHGDIGAVFGLGFPPFTGGPFRYVDTVGVRTIVDRLNALAELHGARFTPAPVFDTMARARADAHRRFYPAGGY
ncbi:3-hydroxyacyl-CoA dehydrogenase NAD-binding domain-containing protein [Salinisphaera sp. T31B1]|uniref:3-hydroxyacyl-CoA dehydrogenase NAD-binding domain-containing protein n=1 Tax=Salinisphaera sp. T31B1 TaxID=727963 RepID=UPI003340823A